MFKRTLKHNNQNIKNQTHKNVEEVSNSPLTTNLVEATTPDVKETIGEKRHFINTPPNITTSKPNPKRTFLNTLPEVEIIKNKNSKLTFEEQQAKNKAHSIKQQKKKELLTDEEKIISKTKRC